VSCYFRWSTVLLRNPASNFAISNCSRSQRPGSFTGIRVGVAAAQAWAQAFARPVLGASVLEAMVEEARPESDCAVAVMDARGESSSLEHSQFV